LTAAGLVKPLGSGIERLVVEVIDSKHLKAELHGVQHLSTAPVNLFSILLFEKRVIEGVGSDKI
jgi:hypothetical protein